MLLNRADFYCAAEAAAHLPRDSRAEVAFAGRSNTGKSSAINVLTGRRQLARVSKTPGRTRQINFFSVDDERFIVDLPGYGYARAPRETKQRWAALLSEYLLLRQPLRGLVVVMDARHPLTELDSQLLDCFAPTAKPVHVLLSKADKLSRLQASAVIERVGNTLATRYSHCSVQLFSSATGSGVAQAQAIVTRWLGMAPPDCGAGPVDRIKNPRLKGTKTGGKPH